MAHSEVGVRCEGIRLLFALVRIEEDHRKTFLVQNYDLISTSLNLLKREASPRVILTLLDLITCCILKSSNQFNPENYSSSLNAIDLIQNTDFSYLEQFLQLDGANIY
jgi:hypothetical protein